MEKLNSIEFSIIISVAILISPYILKRWQSISGLKGLVTTFGILGTFIGIFSGLLAFDVANIQGSVPKLLSGLQTAFLTSISGMCAGILLTISPRVYGITIQEEDKSQDELVQQMARHLANMDRSLTGDGESTLLTQIQKLRTTFSDKQDELNKSFREFADKVVADSTQSLIDALTEVMKDFNTKINEQFGDNFKQLNDAVSKMLVWQQEYSERVEAMTKQFERTLEGVQKCETALTNISSQSQKFSDTAKQLNAILSALEQEKVNLQNGVNAFADMASKAKETFPIIHEQLNKVSKDLTTTVSLVVTENTKQVNAMKDTLNNQAKQLQESNQQLSNQVQKITADFNGRTEKMLTQMSEKLTTQVTELDKQLGEELNKSISTLGRHLTSLSKTFVDDYSNLTTRLREILNLASK